jgi:tRNA-dihydrouridine synthase 1
MDILHRYAEGVDPPQRKPLFVPGDEEAAAGAEAADTTADEPPTKKRRKDTPTSNKRPDPNPNLSAVQSHLFHLLRHLVSRHTDVRDMPAFESVLTAVESKVAAGLAEYERTGGSSWEEEVRELYAREEGPEGESSVGTMKRCKRPWWVVQPIVRPLPSEAIAKGAIRPSKKDRQEQKKKEVEGESGKGTVGKSEDAAAVLEGDGEKKNGDVPVEAKNGTLKSTEQQKHIAARDELVAG